MKLKLEAGDPAAERVRGSATVAVGGEIVELEMAAPAGKVRISEILPILWGVTNHIVDRAEAKAAAEGRWVTCAKGCGACCRQIVPVSEAEAHALGRLVAAMPEPRQQAVRARFAEALAALAAKGLDVRVNRLRAKPGSRAAEVGLAWFAAGVACPFLEEEACSIHPERPLACRQYLVTSDPAHCAAPKGATVAGLEVPSRPSTALLLLDQAETGIPWLPLTWALEFHEGTTEPAPRRTAPDILQEFFARLKPPAPEPANAPGPAKRKPPRRR